VINNDFGGFFHVAHCRDGGHKQLISNGGRFNLAFVKRDKKPTIIDLRGISTNWFKTQLCPSTRLSRLYGLSQWEVGPNHSR
jgi:hypothetical protein